MTARQYILAMHAVVIPLIEQQFPNKADFLYIDDGAPAHTAKAAQDWKFYHWGAKVLPRKYWAPYSPDRNPIEHCWGIMKEEIIRRNPRSMKGLRRAIIGAWGMITVPLLEKLFDSLDVRDNAIIEAEGGHTKF
jgi:hypothetical protein